MKANEGRVTTTEVECYESRRVSRRRTEVLSKLCEGIRDSAVSQRYQSEAGT